MPTVSAFEKNVVEYFEQVFNCLKCQHERILLDDGENIQQPGFVGANYLNRRVLLVGRNPGFPREALLESDKVYTSALRKLKENSNAESFHALRVLMLEFMPKWPIYKQYIDFVLQASELNLSDIAYCNLIPCRLKGKSSPPISVMKHCAESHFRCLLKVLEPKVVVFIGKYPCDQGLEYLTSPNLSRCIDCSRSLNQEKRQENLHEVGRFVLSALGAM